MLPVNTVMGIFEFFLRQGWNLQYQYRFGTLHDSNTRVGDEYLLI